MKTGVWYLYLVLASFIAMVLLEHMFGRTLIEWTFSQSFMWILLSMSLADLMTHTQKLWAKKRRP